MTGSQVYFLFTILCLTTLFWFPWQQNTILALKNAVQPVQAPFIYVDIHCAIYKYFKRWSRWITAHSLFFFFFFFLRHHLKLHECLLSGAWKSPWISISYSEGRGKSQKWACLCNHDNKYLYIIILGRV